MGTRHCGSSCSCHGGAVARDSAAGCPASHFHTDMSEMSIRCWRAQQQFALQLRRCSLRLLASAMMVRAAGAACALQVRPLVVGTALAPEESLQRDRNPLSLVVRRPRLTNCCLRNLYAIVHTKFPVTLYANCACPIFSKYFFILFARP